jgi:hypothetical protein
VTNKVDLRLCKLERVLALCTLSSAECVIHGRDGIGTVPYHGLAMYIRPSLTCSTSNLAHGILSDVPLLFINFKVAKVYICIYLQQPLVKTKDFLKPDLARNASNFTPVF